MEKELIDRIAAGGDVYNVNVDGEVTGRTIKLPTDFEFTKQAQKQSIVYPILKRTMDIIFSLLAIILFSPVFLIIAIAVRVDSKGSALYAQERVGKGNKPFKMLKFRSMCMDADEKLEELKDMNEKDGPIFKIIHDPRVTKVGKFLRRTSLDELPQFLNILMGHMSIVGPRPPLVCEVSEYEECHMRRLDVKPGLTCYWQISGRSDLSFDKWIELDMKYISERSILTDIKIILKTIPAVLGGKGAY
ncbi:MAG: capsular polysaccharide biosynthsis protein [Oscillospiraceae bacterium]|jgi:exopolysaccharide biosynthesis polyprenyl glycosylphosphotransferase|nr:capsular polysaccharide biosynthsis protein [Oscillospiraceae bacterium]